jgi:hypothetical protein
MRPYARAVALSGGLALVAGLLAISTAAQEPRTKTKAKEAQPAPVAEPAKVAHPPGVHVPDYFAQLEPPLTPEQRERIYEIQARALRESEAVLTPAQRTSLQELRSKGGRPARGTAAPAEEPPHKPAARKKAG